MSTSLPPNPFTRSPIRDLAHLGGRDEERKTLNYYLDLVSAGQSPHLALIGPRGAGKTSLLNAASTIAVRNRVLPIRIDLNEGKVIAPGVFWHDFYTSLISEAVNAGAWGGQQGTIYAALFRLLFQRTSVESDLIVLQLPFALCSHAGPLETAPCPDALIIRDIGAVVQELSRHGLVGLAILIDEGDCLAANRPLLQMIRNVFQIVPSAALIITGTTELFGAVSDVFSPIPRQFHRVNIDPFRHWTETRSLVTGPLDEKSDLWPDLSTITELHELCAGDPSELQLYCHHMYRALDKLRPGRMQLTPQVYRAVVSEYRGQALGADADVLDAIERIPDSLIRKASWLKRFRLTAEENYQVERLVKELRRGGPMSAEDADALREEIRKSYELLLQLGVSTQAARLEMKGGAVAAGYWKSHVQAERAIKWTWNDRQLSRVRYDVVLGELSRATKSIGMRSMPLSGEADAVSMLDALRKGKSPAEVLPVAGNTFAQLIGPIIAARRQGAPSCVDVRVSLNSGLTNRSIVVTYAADDESAMLAKVQEFFARTEEVLGAHEFTHQIEGSDLWPIPSNQEMQRMAHITGVNLPDIEFGPSLIAVAIDEFLAGRPREAAELFSSMLKDKDQGPVRNNLGYCQLVLGDIDSGLVCFERSVALSRSGLNVHNLAVARAIAGSSDAARLMVEALELQSQQSREDARSASCMLVLTPERTAVRSVDKIPIDASAIINLSILGHHTRGHAVDELRRRYPDEHEQWLHLLEA